MSQSNLNFGWIPDMPDMRDYSPSQEEVRGELVKLKGFVSNSKKELALKAVSLPSIVDLRSFCTPIEDQGALGSCTANAGVGLLEYFEKRAFGKFTDGSRLFLYKVTRNLLGWTGDTGAYLRTTMQAMAGVGVSIEKYHPYIIANYDQEPSAFNYALASNFKSIIYYRLDPAGTSGPAALQSVKNYLANNLPSMFGFTCYNNCLSQASSNGGQIPYPTVSDRVVGGHAVVAIGYDDTKEIKNLVDGSKAKGAILIRNSWGTSWGDGGYGWLPYKYFETRLAIDIWSLVKSGWFDSSKF